MVKRQMTRVHASESVGVDRLRSDHAAAAEQRRQLVLLLGGPAARRLRLLHLILQYRVRTVCASDNRVQQQPRARACSHGEVYNRVLLK